jgi:DNA helicase IV
MVGKDLFVLTNVFLDNSHCTNHLRCSLPFLCKIQVRAVIDKKKIAGTFPCLLLDEAQDFTALEVANFLSLGRTVFAVADIRQQIYERDDAAFKKLCDNVHTVETLKYHYRNGREICKFVDALRKDEGATPPMIDTSRYDEAVAPSSVSWKSCDLFDDQIGTVISTLETQIIAYPTEVIAILCPNNSQVKHVMNMLSAKGIDFSDNYVQVTLGGAEQAGVFVSTIHSAKGLEFRAAHLVGLEGLMNLPHSRGLVFTACARTKTSLALYHSGRINLFLRQLYADLYEQEKEVATSEAFGKVV